MHGVTLGGTGKESGDRHPKVGNGVFIAAGATVLGNIEIGDGSVINAGSVVVKPVPAFTRVGGVPAKFICTFEDISQFDPDVLSMERYEEDPSPATSRSACIIRRNYYSSSDFKIRSLSKNYLLDTRYFTSLSRLHSAM
jgi:hypothetical protein